MKFFSLVVFSLVGGTCAAGGLDTVFPLTPRSLKTSTTSEAITKRDAERRGMGMSGKDTMCTECQCHKLKKLMWLEEVAKNATELQQVTKGNATEAAEIKSLASEDAPKLASLQANATLMAACSQVFAVEDMLQDCVDMLKMQALGKIAANATLLNEKTDGDSTATAAVMAKVKEEAATLTMLESNTTLTAFCAVEETKADCSAMGYLKKEIAFSKNTTAVAEHFHNDAAKIAAFQEKIPMMESKLSKLMSNSTLMSFCAMEKTSTSSSAGAATTTPGTYSGAVHVRPAVATVSLAALAFACALLL
ncbi:hypothetical protein P8C59_006296 [Phyllachora maydis]|uniref:Uncharacterized protein n=1 Tax=Phyllachora maydis TaxID=1825666 RepID=A0AAD9MGJ6_9PEZI|nr:hypothetical protein P8C59_006296 [Phyllachora maydis]